MIYKVYKDVDRQLYCAFFAFQLESIGVSSCETRDARDYIVHILNRQTDFIATLPSLGEGSAIELRYISRPVPEAPYRGRIDVILRVRVDAADKNGALQAAVAAYDGLWPNLVSVSDAYQWVPIDDSETYKGIFDDSGTNHLAELVRRELVVQLDRVELLPSKRSIGFHTSMAPAKESRNPDSSVYVIIPYTRTFSTLETLFNVLLLQKHSVIVSIALSPTNLRQEELDYLLEQTQRCERYIQLPGSGPVTQPEKFIPPMRSQAEMVLQNLHQAIFSLRDDCVLFKTQIASPEYISPAIIDALGITITEPVSSTDRFSDADTAHRHLAGGYDWIAPESAAQKKVAKSNFDNILFDPWETETLNSAQRLRYLADPRQANAAFRFPVPEHTDFPGLETRLARLVSPPRNLPDEGLLIGNNFYRGMHQPVRLLRDDRRRHTYVVGQTGTGKSSLLLSMIMQDIRNGEGVCVLDPHGELVDEILLRIPEKRAADVIYFNPEDQRSVIGLNLLEYRDDIDRDSAVNHLMEIFDKLYNLDIAGGPMFEMYLRNSALLVMDDSSNAATIVDILRVFSDKAFRTEKIGTCNDRFVSEFWENVALKATSDHSLPNLGPYITSKFSRLLYNSLMRPIVCQQRSTVDFLKAMNEGRIILVDLCKGKLGDTNSAFLGMILSSLIQRAAFARSGMAKRGELKDFYLYVDEFQNLATDGFIAMLSEARKYRLNLILTNQYLHQIPEDIHNAVLGNVGTQISFRVGMKDAKILEDEFLPVVGQTDLMNLPNYHAYLTTLIKGEATKPFSIKTQLDPSERNGAIAWNIIENSGSKFGRPKSEVDEEIDRRWGAG